jgi:CRISPR-associated endonuclease Cas1
VFRVRFLLRLTKSTRMPAHHAAVLYALTSEAFGQADQRDPIMPDGVMLDAPEQCRTWLAKNDTYAFGLTILAGGVPDATSLADSIQRGLVQVGRRAAQRQAALGGNFRLERCEDLVADRSRNVGQPLLPIAIEKIESEIHDASRCTELTLQFVSPLRCGRPKQRCLDGHAYFDREYFSPASFLSRLHRRLNTLGVSPLSSSIAIPDTEPGVVSTHASVGENQLVWLDISYGMKKARKALGGAQGRVRITAIDPVAATLLVWGQYVRIGEGTRFGFGNYRIEQLGLMPYACARSSSLLHLALQSRELDDEAERHELGSGILGGAARRLIAGEYQPAPPTRIEITTSSRTRVLAIPRPLDRALQRAVLKTIDPGVDMLLEDSSLAYRHGLGRQRAALRINEAYRRGFQWALKSDFSTFFDSVDHAILEQRLAAYLADDELVRAIMLWVASSSPRTHQGLPTGAPLSPLLSNLFLDRFDEHIQAQGGYLVRYADDFVILYRTPDEAQRAYAVAEREAAELCLELNREKTKLLDLSEPFDFLGFRFQHRDRWEMAATGEPALLEDLGWQQGAAGAKKPDDAVRLPGESDYSASPEATVIWGPGVDQLNQQGSKLICSFDDGRRPARVPLDNIRELIILGTPTYTRNALPALVSRGIHVLLVDEWGRLLGSVIPEDNNENAEVLASQTQVAQDPQRGLEIARRLVAAKLHNYATLAGVFPLGHGNRDLKEQLRELAGRAADCGEIEQLLGFEGAGAARWYGSFATCLPSRFSFSRRVAPRAEDPVNALLNLSQTILYRHMIFLIRQAGMSPYVGFLHRARAGHATLASDMQEAFRHLMDRAVLETLPTLRTDDFEPVEGGPYALRIRPRAIRELLARVHRLLATPCCGQGQSEPKAYRFQAWAQIRSLRRHLSDPSQPFQVFFHP